MPWNSIVQLLDDNSTLGRNGEWCEYGAWLNHILKQPELITVCSVVTSIHIWNSFKIHLILRKDQQQNSPIFLLPPYFCCCCSYMLLFVLCSYFECSRFRMCFVQRQKKWFSQHMRSDRRNGERERARERLWQRKEDRDTQVKESWSTQYAGYMV